MRYLVHYSVANERRTAEVEAASPEGAVVKLRHTRADHETPRGHGIEILSVSPEPSCEELAG